MIDLESWDRLGALRVEYTGNEPVLLNDDACLRFVESGSMGLFAVRTRDGAPAGPRRLLGRIGPGRSAFSAPRPEDEGLQLLLVPIGPCVVRELPLAALDSPEADEEPGLGDLLDSWVARLEPFLEAPGTPELPLRITLEGEVPLEAEQAMCADRNAVLWCRVEEGAVQINGAGASLDEAAGTFVLGAGRWLRALDVSIVDVLRSSSVAADDVAAGLAALHGDALDALTRTVLEEDDQERLRLRERDRIQRRQTEEAVVDLARVLEPGAPRQPKGDPLLVALSMVGAQLGVEIRPAAKSDLSSRGADPVQSIARASRLRVRRIALYGKWWKRDCGPLLAFSADDDARPLALLQRANLKYEVHDPRDGSRRALTSRLADELRSEAVTLYRPLPEGKLKLTDLFTFSLGRRGRDLLLVILTGLAATLLGMVPALTMRVLMDDVVPEGNRALLYQLGGVLLAAAFGRTIFSLAQGIVLQRVGLASEAESQAALWDRLLRLRPSFFRKFSSGDLQSRVMAVNQIGREISGAALTSIFSGFLSLLNLGLLYYYSPRLSVLALGIAAFVLVFTLVLSTFIRRNYEKLIELEGKLFGTVVQLINAVGKLRVAGAERRAYTHWVRRFGQQLALTNKAARLEDLVFVFNNMLPAISSMLLFAFAHGMMVESREAGAGLTLGTFLAFNSAFVIFLGGATSLSSTVVEFLDTLIKGRRVKPILEEEPEIDLSKADPGVLAGSLQTDSVDFQYSPDGPKILDGVSLRAEPGEFVAIVGPSGSGKSTLLRHLLGFEVPTSGTVRYDGQDLASLDVLAVRRQLGVVLQGGKLDAGSIFQNIASGNIITLDDAWAAAEDAGVADDIRDMPMGMHTIISVGGGNLSGGQRQRLLIARALAQRPRLILFDEATSALDNRTQAVVSESLERLEVTRIVIAHRLSTIRNADRVYVIDRGEVVQQGGFDELLRAPGLFQRMMARQLA